MTSGLLAPAATPRRSATLRPSPLGPGTERFKSHNKMSYLRPRTTRSLLSGTGGIHLEAVSGEPFREEHADVFVVQHEDGAVLEQVQGRWYPFAAGGIEIAGQVAAALLNCYGR